MPPSGVQRAAAETAAASLGLSLDGNGVQAKASNTNLLPGTCTSPTIVQSQPSQLSVQFAAPDMRDTPPTLASVASQCKSNPKPWTGQPANAPSIEFAIRTGTYVSPEELNALQPPVPLPCDNRATNASLTGQQNEFVAADGIAPFGNVFWPQAIVPGVGPGIPPAGTLPVSSYLDPISSAVGGPMSVTWQTKPATEVRDVNEVLLESNSSAWLSNQAWLSFGSAPYPGAAPP